MRCFVESKSNPPFILVHVDKVKCGRSEDTSNRPHSSSHWFSTADMSAMSDKWTANFVEEEPQLERKCHSKVAT